ncbi:MAG: enoyl-CoA hydratase/isomerase family protein [Bacteroidota bacterium]|nr:enoyl-CoA hydratase/isomerase family protein [Bacteroidota bacterium]
MEHQFINLQIQDKIADLHIHKPEKMNALDSVLLQELSENISKLEKNKDIKALFITGTPDVFSAGGDLQYMAKMNESEGCKASTMIQDIFNRIESLPFLTISLVQGIAFGGGLELGLCCDVCIAGDKAKFALPEMRYGIIPAGGGTIRFLEKTNLSQLLYIMTYQKIMTPTEAYSCGLIQDIVRDEDMEKFKAVYKQKLQAIHTDTLVKIKSHIKQTGAYLHIPERTRAFENESKLFGHLLEKEGRDKMNAFFEQRKNEN